MRIAFGGLYEQQQNSFRELFFVLLGGLLLVSIVLLFQFGDWRAPLVTAVISVAVLAGRLRRAPADRDDAQHFELRGRDHDGRASSARTPSSSSTRRANRLRARRARPRSLGAARRAGAAARSS